MVRIAMRIPYNLVYLNGRKKTRRIPIFCDGIDPITKRRTWLLNGDGAQAIPKTIRTKPFTHFYLKPNIRQVKGQILHCYKVFSFQSNVPYKQTNKRKIEGIPWKKKTDYNPSSGNPSYGQYSPTRDQYPPAKDQYSPTRDQYPPARDQYPPARDQYHPASDQNPPATGRNQRRQPHQPRHEEQPQASYYDERDQYPSNYDSDSDSDDNYRRDEYDYSNDNYYQPPPGAYTSQPASNQPARPQWQAAARPQRQYNLSPSVRY